MVSSTVAGKESPGKTSRTTSAPDKKAEKREIAKTKILNATLDIIAREGLAALSHRSIASVAGVQLAMTTYYFGTIDNILVAAFRQFRANMEPVIKGLAQQLEELLASSAVADGSLASRQSYADAFASELEQYIDIHSSERVNLLRIECQYLFEQHPSQALTEEIQEYTDWVTSLALRFVSPLGGENPRMDAHMLLWTVQYLEFSTVTSVTIKGASNGDVLRRLLRGFCV
ncbi:TetR/AcrR family transcriptional regulator [Microbulbifer sp. YPW1]|uniref:TetR/AcrR family transcriptional regulator n=1 Tax=Microbulbifer sp. YPW1 TaxID=2745199 RepID=UPI00159AADCF|nr:hypothetical protein [Microbulbifer sp. YPW1]QKX16341.1 hypothetical protein HUW35_04690 [Microbulbifer sp. YPW1]